MIGPNKAMFLQQDKFDLREKTGKTMQRTGDVVCKCRNDLGGTSQFNVHLHFDLVITCDTISSQFPTGIFHFILLNCHKKRMSRAGIRIR